MRVTRQVLTFQAPREISIVEEPIGRLGSHEVLVDTIISGISQGTEMAWFLGVAGGLTHVWDDHMRTYRPSFESKYPVTPGYESVGRVAEVGLQVSNLEVGDLVTLDAGHATRHVVSGDSKRLAVIPPEISPEDAVFLPLARVALGGVHDAEIIVGDVVVVVGAGIVGLLAAQLARIAGAGRVLLVDYPGRRLEIASSLGIEVVEESIAGETAYAIKQAVGGGADVAIECSGSFRGLQTAIHCVGVRSRVVTVSSYHESEAALSLNLDYHKNAVTLISSMTINGVPHRRAPMWDLARQNEAVRRLMVDSRLQLEGLITHRIPFDRAADAYELLASGDPNLVKATLIYE